MNPVDPSSLQPVTLHSLITDHKLIGALLGFVVLVFLVSITKIVLGLIRIRKIKRIKRELDRHG